LVAVEKQAGLVIEDESIGKSYSKKRENRHVLR
jgi:hypothetical protein